MSLIVKNVSKTYESGIWKTKKFQALNNVSFTLEKGRVLALIGQNGAGKTTLIKCILRFIRPSQGTITMNGNEISSLIKTSDVGYMPEKLQLPQRQLLDAYIEDLMILRGKNKTCYQPLYNEYVQKLFMTQHLTKNMDTFSKGTAKKVAFIQSVLHQPQLVILDEPTDGLDPVSRRVLLNEINNLKSNGSSVIITTHLLSDISRIADEVIVLQRGEIVEEKSMCEIPCALEDWYLQIVYEHGGMEA